VKKLLLILLLTILPIQHAWSMAAVYCQHEPAKVTHFGHHGHQHQAQSDDGADESKPVKVHSDCEVCHHAVQASVPAGGGVDVVVEATGHAPPGARRYLSHISEGPQRPNWLLVA
jgi:hypothetical protein